jgi:hypothetical protein
MVNADRPPEAHRYSDELATFSFIAETFSSHCYRFIRTILDLPSQQTLYTRFNGSVEEMEHDLTHIEGIPKRVTEYLNEHGDSQGPLACTLCIDAFTVDPTHPGRKCGAAGTVTVSESRADDDADPSNSFFLLQLTPWNREYRVAPLHLLAAKNGSASGLIRQSLEQAIREVRSADTRLDRVIVSVDGDEGYSQYFERCFQIVKTCIAQEFDSQRLSNMIRDARPFWVSDFLHLLKNARTRLFTSEICVNPTQSTDGAHMTRIATFFESSLTFSDESTLGKM